MATYYVATTGANSGAGTTSGAPWLTIQYAITNSTTGDTIVLAAGTYTQSADLTLSARTYRGAGYASTIIDFAGGNYRLYLNGAAITIEDLQIYRITRTNEESCVENQVSGAVIAMTRVWFRNLIVGIVRGVISTDGAFGTVPSTMTLTSCLFTGSEKRTSSADPSGYIFSQSATTLVTMIGCVIYSAASLAALAVSMNHSSGPGQQFICKNCIFVSTQSVTFAGYNYAHTYTGSATNCIYGSWTTVPAGVAATVTSDPLFVDAANDDFNLRPTSPCINTGTLV